MKKGCCSRCAAAALFLWLRSLKRDIREKPLQRGGPDAADGQQILREVKSPVLLPFFDDPLRQGRADARQLGQLVLPGKVDGDPFAVLIRLRRRGAPAHGRGGSRRIQLCFRSFCRLAEKTRQNQYQAEQTASQEDGRQRAHALARERAFRQAQLPEPPRCPAFLRGKQGLVVPDQFADGPFLLFGKGDGRSPPN